MIDVLIDTDVASLLHKGRAPAWVTRHLAGARVGLTFVTVGELWKWAEIRSWGHGTRARLDRWIAQRAVLPSDDEVARTWGWLAAEARRRGHPRPQNDTWVAACAVRHGVPLLTLNRKDFVAFAEYAGLMLLADDM